MSESYSTVGISEEAGAIDTEWENEQPRSCSLGVAEQGAKAEYASEQDATELELSKTSVSSKIAKKKKAKSASKPQNSVYSAPGHLAE